MRILLVSTYELGHQPLHVAAPAAELAAAGHSVSALDLAVQEWDPSLLDDVDAVAVSVPMHTALRLAVQLARRIRNEAGRLPIAFYGLYAGVGAAERSSLVDRHICGEYEDALVAWVDSLAAGERNERGTTVSIGRRRFRRPDRAVLPGLGEYAHLATPDGHRLVGYVEASHGCRHRCAHCPVPTVYDGRYRITGRETVLADIAQLVEAGAGHVTFGDPDFLNAPVYALDVLEEARRRFPELSFDITAKVEHLIEHRRLLPRLAEAGVIFIVSAFESMDDRILSLLDKGHTSEDAHRAVDLANAAGIDLHPTWLPFTPWTTTATVADIARFVWERGLAPVTDPVQLSIRLLLPDGSLLVDRPETARHVTSYDPDVLGYRWVSPHPEVDVLQRELEQVAERGAALGQEPLMILADMTACIAAAAGVEIPTDSGLVVASPRLTEPWFC